MTNDGISEIIPTGNLNSYINFRANDTGFIIICGNGFPPIPQTSQYIVSFKIPVVILSMVLDFIWFKLWKKQLFLIFLIL